MEPLLFLSLAENSAVGISANPGRILQAIVWIGLMLGWLSSRRRLRIFNPTHPLYANYSLYFLCSVVAAAIGITSGAYTLHTEYGAANATTFIASVIRGPLFRPFFEYVILIYYFVYFVVLPRYLLNSDQGVTYFFRVFSAVFAIGLVLGAIDLLLIPLGIEFIPRHITG